MASDINAKEDRYPWISWAMTGVLTLAVVLAVGLVITRTASASAGGTAGGVAEGYVARAVQRRCAGRGKLNWRESAADECRAAGPASRHSGAGSGTGQRSAVGSVRPDIAGDTARCARQPPKPSLVKTEPPPAESHAVQSPPAVQAAPDAAKQAAYVKAVAGVRQAMAQRNLASKRLLKTAADKAQTDSERAEVERLEIIQDHLEQFWDGIRKAVAEMQPTDEIVLSESNRVAVIECSREELVVQWEGKPRRYRIEAMPMELLSAVAKASFKLTPGTKLVVGSFLAVDAHGDRAEARKLWREAIAGGEADGKLLMPELDVPLPKAR